MGDDPNAQGNSRRWIIAECENSLRRLAPTTSTSIRSTDPDETVEIDQTLGALTDLVHAGKIRAFGSSTFPAEQIVEAQWVAERRGRERFMTEQPPYSILVRGIERDVLPVAQSYGMGVIPWSPLAGGWLSGTFGTGKENTSRRAQRLPGRYDLCVPANQKKLEIVTELAEVADEAGLTIIELALAFVLEHPAVSAAIIGPRTMDQLESQLSAPDVRLERPCWTASTRSSLRAPTSIPKMPAGHPRCWPIPGSAAATAADPTSSREEFERRVSMLPLPCRRPEERPAPATGSGLGGQPVREQPGTRAPTTTASVKSNNWPSSQGCERCSRNSGSSGCVVERPESSGLSRWAGWRSS